jgi:hypothetical protein
MDAALIEILPIAEFKSADSTWQGRWYKGTNGAVLAYKHY